MVTVGGSKCHLSVESGTFYQEEEDRVPFDVKMFCIRSVINAAMARLTGIIALSSVLKEDLIPSEKMLFGEGQRSITLTNFTLFSYSPHPIPFV